MAPRMSAPNHAFVDVSQNRKGQLVQGLYSQTHILQQVFTFSDSSPLKSSHRRNTARKAAVMMTPTSFRFCQASCENLGTCAVLIVCQLPDIGSPLR